MNLMSIIKQSRNVNCKGAYNKPCNVLQTFQLAHRPLFILFPEEMKSCYLARE